MGASSRPMGHYKLSFTAEQSLNYFVNYIEKWRKQFSLDFGFELTDFYLMGHSFGAYLASHYTVKYHQHVKKLLLLSPLGVKVTAAAKEKFIS